MTLTTIPSFPPVARKEYLDRLAALPPTPAFTPELWTEVHEEIQKQLAFLETEVRRVMAGVRVERGRTKGNKFLLFSYRSFSMPNSAIDPVVAGMTFTPAQPGVTVEADVTGEQSGDWISTVPCKTVGHSREELLAAASASARELCQSARAIAAALKDPSRGIE
jgi:hypothetical protein